MKKIIILHGAFSLKIAIFANGFGEKSGACRKAFEL